MPYPRELLNDGEECLLDRHPHWTYMLGTVSMIAIALVVTIGATIFDPRLGVIGLLVMLMVAIGTFGRFLRWKNTHFVLTTDRLIIRTGVITKSGKEIPLDRVTNISYSHTIIERMLGSGDIVVESAGEQGHQRFTDISDPVKLQNMIYKQADIAERWNSGAGDRTGAPAHRSGGGGEGESAADQLEKLDELHKNGVVTDDEFRKKKQELLDRM